MVKRVATSIITVTVLMGSLVACGGADSSSYKPVKASTSAGQTTSPVIETQSSVQICVPTLSLMVSAINNSERHLRTLKWELDDALYEMRLGKLDSYRLSGIDQSFRMIISSLDKASDDISATNLCDPYLTSLALGLSLNTFNIWDWADHIARGVEPNTLELETFERDLCDLLRSTKIKYPEMSTVTFRGEFSFVSYC